MGFDKKREVIEIIDTLYPTDSKYTETGVVGERLLAQAKRTVGYGLTWRDEPLEVLLEYARLCEAKERSTTRECIARASGV